MFRWLILLTPLVASAADYDLLIRNARLVDGSGNAWFRADVAVKDGRIAAIGRLGSASATRAIDAKGTGVGARVHRRTHSCGGRRRSQPARRQFPPRWRDHRNHRELRQLGAESGRLVRQAAEGGPRPERWVPRGAQYGAAGSDGRANRAATPDEIKKMQSLIDRAMRDGAMGFSTGLEYVPEPTPIRPK